MAYSSDHSFVCLRRHADPAFLCSVDKTQITLQNAIGAQNICWTIHIKLQRATKLRTAAVDAYILLKEARTCRRNQDTV